jgi:hypothetical protein
MAKRTTTVEPVTVREVADVVLKALATAFGDRPLDTDTARRGLSHAAFDLIQLELGEAAAHAAKDRAK